MRLASNKESVENGESTWLAIGETLLAVLLYWGIAWYFDTHIHLLTSIFIAPLLLLRSSESTDKGVRWFTAYSEDDTEITRRGTPVRFWVIIILAFGLSAMYAYLLEQSYLVGYAGWSLFLRAMLVGVVAVWIAVAVAVFFGIPWIIGIWLRSLVVRVVATLSHPLLGLRSLPDNWRRTLLVIDVKHPPELVPGLGSSVKIADFQGLLDDMRSGEIWERIFSAIMLFIFFLPAMLYRWSMKSTCWFYWPLVYLLSEQKWLEEHGPKNLLSDLHDGLSERLRRLVASFVFVFMVATTFYDPLKCTIQDSYSNAPALFYLMAFDLSLLAPWQLCSVVSAFCTLVILLYGDVAYRAWILRQKEDSLADPFPNHIQRLLWLTRFRSISTVILLLLALGYAWLVLYDISPQILPYWLSPLDEIIHMIYAPYLS